MEFSVSRNALLQALKHCRNALNINGVYDIFKNFVFTFPDGPEPGTMTVHASNGEQWISETIAIYAVASPASAPGPYKAFAVYYYEMLRAISTLEDEPLVIRVYDYQLSVHHSCGSFRLPLAKDAEEKEFLDVRKPQPDAEAKGGCRLEYEAPGLRSILSRCKFAMAQDELRPVMNGVCVNLTGDFSDYVSSDGHKLVRVRKDSMFISTDDSESISFIIPSKVVRTLLRILPKTGDAVLEYQAGQEDGNGRASASVIIDDNIRISFFPVDGKYPMYQRVIPENFNYEITINRRNLIKSVDRLNILACDMSELIVMSITENRLHLEAAWPDFELSGEENVDCECKSENKGFPLRIGLKASSVSQTLKAMTSEEVVFHFVDSTRPMIINPKPQPDVEDVTMLLMPMLTG